MVHHIVLLKLKEGLTVQAVNDLFTKIGKLQQSIPGIMNYQWGEYASPEGLNQGYTHGFIMTFKSPEARDAYLPHPDHENLKSYILEHVEGVLAFDFENR